MKSLTPKVKQLTTEQITEYEKSGSIKIDLGEENGTVQLSDDDLEITRSGLEGWQVETENGLSVALDTELDEQLIQEGLAREFVNRIQNMRKEADFEVTDRINIGVEGPKEIDKVILAMNAYIKDQTLAEDITRDALEVADFEKTWEIGENRCTISIRRNPN